MRRIAVGLIFLLGACTEKTEQQALSVTWDEQRSLGTEQQHEWPAEVRLEQVSWTSAARGLLRESTLSIPELAEPPVMDASKLDRFVPAEEKSLNTDAEGLRALEELSSQLGQLRFAGENNLIEAAPVTFPAEWIQ